MRRGGRAASPPTGRGGWRPGWSSRYELPVAPTGLINVTDPDSRVVRTQGQPPLQGYNAQLAVNDRQVVVAAEITTESPDFGHLEPMVRATQRELARASGSAIPRSCSPTPATGTSARCNRSPATASRCSSRPTAACARARGRAGPAASTSFMRRVLATPEGRDLYRQRQITIEPVFGQIKFNRAIKRFQRRGRTACRSEWRLIAATHNLLKLHNHRLAAATP